MQRMDRRGEANLPLAGAEELPALDGQPVAANVTQLDVEPIVERADPLPMLDPANPRPAALGARTDRRTTRRWRPRSFTPDVPRPRASPRRRDSPRRQTESPRRRRGTHGGGA